MPKTLGGRLFLSSIVLISLLGGINIVVATLGFTGNLILGYREGFDAVLIVMSLVFGFLLSADLASIFVTETEKILKSVWPNLFVVIVRLVYLVFAGLLFYGLFWDGGLSKYYWAYLIVAVWLVVVNLPSMIFHLALCVPRYRERLAKIDVEMRHLSENQCTCTQVCDCQKPPPDNWNGKDGIYHVSNECPVHTIGPRPNPDCPIHNPAD